MHFNILERLNFCWHDDALVLVAIEEESFPTRAQIVSEIVVDELPKLSRNGLVCNEEWPVPPAAANTDSSCDSPCRSDRTTGSQSTGFLSASQTLPRERKMSHLSNPLSGSLHKPFDKDSGFDSGLNTQAHTGGSLLPSAGGHDDVAAPKHNRFYQFIRDSEGKIAEGVKVVSSIAEEVRTSDDQERTADDISTPWPVEETRCGSTVGTTEDSRNESGTCTNEPANLPRVETCTQVEGDSGYGLTYLEHQRVQRLGSPFITPLSSERIRLSSASSRQEPEEVEARVPPAHGTPPPEALREDDFHARPSPGGFPPARCCSNLEGGSVGESSDSCAPLSDNRVHQSRHGPLVNEDSCFASDSAHHQAEGGPKHGISSTDCTGPTGCARERSVGGVCEQGRRESPDPASDLPLPVQQGAPHLQSSEDTEVVATRDVGVMDAKNFIALDMKDIPLHHLRRSSAKLRFSRDGRTSFQHGISTDEVLDMATTLHGETPLSHTKQHPYQSHPADHQSECTDNTEDKELAHNEQPNLESQNNHVVTKQMRECTLMSLKAMRNMADRYTVLENGTTLGYVCYSNCAVISQGTYLPLPSSVALSNGIGRGGNGLITNIYHEGREFAVKQTLYRHLEVEVLSSLSHKHILPLEAVMMGEEDPVRRARYLCYHFYPRLSGDLQGYLSRLGRGGLSSELMSRRESQDQLRRIVANTKHLLAGVLRGLAYLHRQGIVHNDIKPSNILLQLPGQCPCPSPFLCACPEELGVVITDFDSAMSVEKLRQTPSLARLLHRSHAIGTPGYRSIEYVLAGTRTTEELTTAVVTAADIWALGCSVLKMFIAHAGPHSQREMAFLRLWSCSGQAQWRVERQRAREMLGVAVLERVFPQWEQLVQLVDDCMQVDPLRRARAEDLLDHPFFSS